MPGGRGSSERFLTTVLMTDIVASTEHAAELGDSGWRELVQLHHALVRAALHRHGGREIDTAGDGFFTIFDAPAAAIDCALEIVRDVRDLGLEIRGGIHVGEVEQIAGKVGGITVPIAARIMGAAGGSEVLVSSTVRDLAAGSGFVFEDHGARQLKGVPGEWHVYAVTRAAPDPANAAAEAASGGAAEASSNAQARRAAAVRRARARPFWQRHPRATAAGSVCLVLVLVATGLLVAKPWQPPALASLAENSVGIIDPSRAEVIGQIPVGVQPGGIAVGDGYAWVTDTGADTVAQISLASRSVVNRIDVGRAPLGIAVADGSVWVANSGDRTLSRINTATARVVQTVQVGNGPTAVAAGADAVWVANASDSTVVRVDARTGDAGTPIGVAATPVALAVDASGVWVASEDGAEVTDLDPTSGLTLAAPIQLAARPSAIALDSTSVWVVASDGTVARIDRATNRLTSTMSVAPALSAVALTNGALWLGDPQGSAYRLNPAALDQAAKRINTGSAIEAMAVVDGSVWVVAQASLTSHRGGTLRVADPVSYTTDPLDDTSYDAAWFEADGLVGYRRVGGALGSELLPDLAASIPQPTNGGLTYTFQLRPNLVYSTGAPVLAQDFRRAIERSFMVAGHFGVVGPYYFMAIVGADACAGDGGDTPVAACDLSAGIQTDDTARTVTFTLSTPDPDLLDKLALPSAYPVPEGVPMNTLADGAFPGTGPYTVTSASNGTVELARNPHFSVWDPAVRPDGYPDQIVFQKVQCPYGDLDPRCPPVVDPARIDMVEKGSADYTSYRVRTATSPDLFTQARTQFAGQWHVGSVSTAYVIFNSSIPPFDNVDARQAVNFALERASSDIAAVPTCQLLPPGWPGYQPYCPYTTNPDPGGRWKGPDLQKAQQLVEASGTKGMLVTVGPTFAIFQDKLVAVGALLQQLGYKVTIDTNADRMHVLQSRGKPQVSVNGWSPDFVAPSDFLGLFLCHADSFVNYCDPTGQVDAAYKAAQQLEATDRAAATAAWAALDHKAVDLAILAPISNSGADFVSARVGNYQFSPLGFPLFDQMWVQ
jgi:YVTN family beta-propeller protein